MVTKGQVVPFSGALFDEVATAIILTDKEQAESKYKLDLDFQLRLQQTNFDLEIRTLELQKRVDDAVHAKVIQIKDKQIAETTKLATEDNSVWWLVGGIALGVLGTSLAVYGAGQLK